ncbi:hypothetical protein PR202_ga02779 [Eleusine coracana subsp. coracana]|uniref:Annexin n=1 Tax=Eleusine coracana subsp. coracana TaxID=191504 RepID=A0AAV5BKP4_ELECO|nr:hypothetical protein PR202_ga02779 [Eleusine coracana subsp. coracana]
MATLTVPATIPPVEEDCEQLRKAFKGWGTNEKLIVSILAHRDAAQRRAIRRWYADAYGEELLRALSDEIHGKFERAVILWTLDPAERDAVLANEEAKKWHPGGRALVEIACARARQRSSSPPGRRTTTASSARSRRTSPRTSPATSASMRPRVRHSCLTTLHTYIPGPDDDVPSSSNGAGQRTTRSLPGRSDPRALAIPQMVSKSTAVEAASGETAGGHSVGGREAVETPTRHCGKTSSDVPVEEFNYSTLTFLDLTRLRCRSMRAILLDVPSEEFVSLFQLLVPLVSAYRYDGPEVNTSVAHSEAKILHEKIHKKAYSDDEIIRILTTRSKAQLLATFNSYNDQFSHPINKDLKDDPKDEFLATLRAIIRCFTCPDRYFEKVIRLALGGMGTDENSLTRVITTRAEVDLKLIMEAYQKRNSVPLEKAVSKDTTRDYEDMLLALLGAE